jgi:pimeloyl-ACP methyl ester carboxylesterase
MPEISSCYQDVNGLRLHYLLAQPQTSSKNQSLIKTLVFLHGFPEHCGVWRRQLAFFGDEYRALALDLPGYNLSQGLDSLDGYSVPNLVGIVSEFIRLIGAGNPVTLIAHDWGGALAWPLANRFPNLLSELVILNAAHPSTFTREMINNRTQRLMSDYIHSFLSDDAEELLRNNNFKALRAHSIDHIKVPLDTSTVNEYLDAWSQDGAVTNMLNYYRAMPQLFPREQAGQNKLQVSGQDLSSPQIDLSKMKIPNIRIEMPTLVLWGEQDQAFCVDVLEGLDDYIDDYQEVRFADASHWLHHEKPSEINQVISVFLHNQKEKGS